MPYPEKSSSSASFLMVVRIMNYVEACNYKCIDMFLLVYFILNQGRGGAEDRLRGVLRMLATSFLTFFLHFYCIRVSHWFRTFQIDKVDQPASPNDLLSPFFWQLDYKYMPPHPDKIIIRKTKQKQAKAKPKPTMLDGRKSKSLCFQRQTHYYLSHL